jgi:O-antigen/teichoic acid export membrane protein
MAARVVDAAFALVYLRLLGRTDVGTYQFLVVFTTYLDTVVDFGLNAVVAREVARGTITASGAVRAVNLLRGGLWLAGLPLVALVYGPLRPYLNLPDDAVLAGWLFYLALLPTILAKTATGVLWAAERLELTASVSVVATLLRTGLGAAALFAGFSLSGLAAASLVTNLVTATILWRLVLAFGLGSALLHAGGSGVRWLRESWPLFVNQLLQSLFFKIDGLLLLPLAGAAAAGTYAAAYKVSEGAGLLSSNFTLALFPRLSRERDLSHAFRLALRFLLQAAFPITVGVALLADPIVAVVGGRGYLPDSAIALSILILYLPLSYANGLMQYVLIAAGRQRVLTIGFAFVLVFNLTGNLLLIPRYSYVGAAWVTVASEIVLLVPFRWAAGQVAPTVSLWSEARQPLLASLLMAPVVWWLRDALHPIAAIAAGAAIYPLALWALGGIDPRQIELLLHLVPRRDSPPPSGTRTGDLT